MVRNGPSVCFAKHSFKFTEYALEWRNILLVILISLKEKRPFKLFIRNSCIDVGDGLCWWQLWDVVNIVIMSTTSCQQQNRVTNISIASETCQLQWGCYRVPGSRFFKRTSFPYFSFSEPGNTLQTFPVKTRTPGLRYESVFKLIPPDFA